MTFIKKISFAFIFSGMLCMSLMQSASSEETFAPGDPRYYKDKSTSPTSGSTADELFRKAESLFDSKLSREALIVLDSAISKSPDSPEYYFLLARICLALDRHELALTALDKAQSLSFKQPAKLDELRKSIKMRMAETATAADKLIPLRTFLQDCQLQKMYKKSLALAKGAPGKSEMLEGLMKLVHTMPWMDEIKVRIVSAEPKYRDYDFNSNTIILRASRSEQEEALDLAHQLYHARNRMLTKLYPKDSKPLTPETYIDLFAWDESAACLTELKTAEQLKFDPNSLIVVDYKEFFTVNTTELIRTKGLKFLHDLLYYCYLRKSNQAPQFEPYHKLRYGPYADSFQQKKDDMWKLIEHCSKDVGWSADEI